MRTKLLVLALSTSLSLLNATFSQTLGDKQPLTLESIFASGEFRSKSLQNIQWGNDGSSFTFTKQDPSTALLNIHEYDIATGNSRLLIAGNNIKYEGKPVRMSRYQWTTDRDFLLITGPMSLTWDSENEAVFYVYETATKRLWSLADNSPTLRNVNLSPDGKRVGYVLDNNLYIVDLNNQSFAAQCYILSDAWR